MRKIALIVAALMLAIPAGGCANLKNAWETLTTSQVSPTAVIVAANTFNALEATATNYLRLKRCDGTNGPVCRDPAVTAKLIPAIRSGRVARTNLEQFLRDHPGQLGPSGLYDSLLAATATIQGIYAQYQIAGAK